MCTLGAYLGAPACVCCLLPPWRRFACLHAFARSPARACTVILNGRDPLYSFQLNNQMKDLILDEEFPPELFVGRRVWRSSSRRWLTLTCVSWGVCVCL